MTVHRRQVVVTGGSSGIGAQICQQFSANGDGVHVLDRNAPGDGRPYTPCDLSDPESIRTAVATLPDTVDVLINAAGVSGLAPIPTVMAVNFYAVRELITAVAPRIPTGGAVVNIASTSGWYWREHLTGIRAVLSATSDQDKSAAIDADIPDGHT